MCIAQLQDIDTIIIQHISTPEPQMFVPTSSVCSPTVSREPADASSMEDDFFKVSRMKKLGQIQVRILESPSISVQSLILILLMEEILHQLIGSLSHYLQGFIHPRWCRISSINSIIHFLVDIMDVWMKPLRPGRAEYWALPGFIASAMATMATRTVFDKVSMFFFCCLK